MLAVSIVAMWLIPIDQVVTTRGVVVSQSSKILVQPLETAIVRSIDVREGQEVHTGQLLARLDPTFSDADTAALLAQVSNFEAEVARLEAEATGKIFTYSGSDPHWLIQAEIFGHRKAEFDSKADNYRNRLDEASAVIARSEADALAFRERLSMAQNVERARKKLEAMHYGSPMETWMATDNRAEMARSLSNAEQTALGARREQAALAAERDSFIRGWRGDVSQKLSDARSKASDARELLNKAKRRSQLMELRSDVDGVVQAVDRVSVGSVLQSGEHFITLVPINAPLEIEANIAGRDNGHVHANDPVIVKFDTFPFSQYGYAEGTVRVISPDSFNAQIEARNPTSEVPAPVAGEPFYRARIAIDRVALHGVPVNFHVIPGMPVTADIKVGKRTVLQYLFGMVAPVPQEALREP
jgi:HlyD family secretion protein